MDAGIVGSGNIGATPAPYLEFSAYLSRLGRADERTRRADLISLRVRIHALQGFARACRYRISKPRSFPWLAVNCTVLRSRWCQSGCQERATALVGDFSKSCSFGSAVARSRATTVGRRPRSSR
jgi:hypothetical protein